jgi:glutamate-1-semialdehyde 2,1-aminomutase
MACLAPLGKVYQAGTLSGNPMAVAAGLATLRLLHKQNPYAMLERLTRRVVEPLTSAARAKVIPIFCRQMGSMFTIFFCKTEVIDLATAKMCDAKRYAGFFHAMLQDGFYLPPAQFETAFVSTSHTDEEIDAFAESALKIIEKPSGKQR